MASYVQSTVNPQYFQVPDFAAPTDFLYQVSRQKQLDFDKGIQSVSAKYQSMANLPVGSLYGKAKLDALMSDATEKLRKVSGADFSLDENVAAANSVYKPITQDKDILTDLSLKAQSDKEISTINSLRNSKDEKDRSMYWDTGAEYVYNSIEKYKNATNANDLHGAQIRRFVPYTDVIGKLNKAAKDLDLGISLDHITGGYIITDKNGEKANIPFYLFAQSQLGTPEREVFKVLGTVEADRQVKEEMYRNGWDEGTARHYLATEAVNERYSDFTEQMKENLSSISSLKTKRDAIVAANNGQITEGSVLNQLNEIDDKIEMVSSNNNMITEKLSDLGFTKFQGHFIRNDKYDRTLSYYRDDLSIPYAEKASKNITRNWAAGLASATTSQKITADPNFAVGVDLQMKELELRAKVSEAEQKVVADKEKEKTKAAEKEAPHDYINDPLQLDNNPFGQEKMSLYDQLHSVKTQYEHDLYGRGTDFIYETLGVDANFLTAITENMKNGASSQSIYGKSNFALADRPELKRGLDQVLDMVKKRELPSNMIYSNLFQNLLNRAKQVSEEKLKNPEQDTEKLKSLVTMQEELKENLNGFRAIKDAESKITSKVLSGGRFDLIKGEDGNIINKDAFLERLGFAGSSGSSSISTGDFVAAGGAALFMGPAGLIAGPAIKRLLSSNVIGKKEIGDLYDKIKTGFDEDFRKYINTDPSASQILSGIPRTVFKNGEVGFTYPIQEWKLAKNSDKTHESEIGEVALKRAFTDANVLDETKILNLDQFPDKSKAMNLIQAMSGNIQDADENTGTVYTTQVGSDGKSFSVIFKPSVSFLKQFAKKGNVIDDATLEVMSTRGIEMAADIPEVEKHRPSLVGRLIEMDGNYKVLPELASQGFGATIEKVTNGRGYKLYLDYKTLDEKGNIVTKTRQDMNYPIIPEQRLDLLSRSTVNGIIDYYIDFLRKSKAVEQTQVQPKVYTVEEYEAQRKIRK